MGRKPFIQQSSLRKIWQLHNKQNCTIVASIFFHQNQANLLQISTKIAMLPKNHVFFSAKLEKTNMPQNGYWKVFSHQNVFFGKNINLFSPENSHSWKKHFSSFFAVLSWSHRYCAFLSFDYHVSYYLRCISHFSWNPWTLMSWLNAAQIPWTSAQHYWVTSWDFQWCSEIFGEVRRLALKRWWKRTKNVETAIQIWGNTA